MKRKSAQFAAALGLILAAAAGQARADLVVNGGFETGDFTGWTTSNDDGPEFNFVGGGFTHTGDSAAWFGNLADDGPFVLSQSLATVAGTSYSLSFWFAGDGDSPSFFSAIVGGTTVFSVTDPAFDADYVQYTFDFTATSAATLLQFDSYDSPFYLNLDDVSVNSIPSAVPAPPSLLMAGVPALIGLARAGLRRRRTAASA